MSSLLLLILVPLFVIAMFALVVILSIGMITFTIKMPKIAIPIWITSYLLFWAIFMFSNYGFSDGIIGFFVVVFISVAFLFVIAITPEVEEDKKENSFIPHNDMHP